MELKYEKYNKVNYKLNNTIRLFANVFIKKGNKNTSENILHTLLQEFKKKRFQEEKLNQTSHITLRETIEEVSPALKAINVPFKKRRKWTIIRKKWRKRIKWKRTKVRKNYHFLIYNSKSLIKNGSRILRKNIKTKRLTQELFKTLAGKSSILNLRKDIYNDIKKITYEAKM